MLPLRGQSGPGSNGYEGMLWIPQSSSITRTSPSDCLMSYQDTRCGGEGRSYSAEKQSVYSTAPANWAAGADKPLKKVNQSKCYTYSIEKFVI